MTKDQLEELRNAAFDREAVLVISKAHFEDACVNVDSETVERFAGALDLFQPALRFVVEGPHAIEPHDGTGDLVAAPGDLRELLASPAAADRFAESRRSTEATHLVDKVSSAIRRDLLSSPVPLSKHAFSALLGAFVYLFRWRCRCEPEDVLCASENELGPVATSERATVLTHLTATGCAVHPLIPPMEEYGFNPERVLRDYARRCSDRAASPGQGLALACIEVWQRDWNRHVLRSDWLDFSHLSYFPHVDIATCDEHTFELLRANGISDFGTTVIRNRRLPDVIRALRCSTEERSIQSGRRGAPASHVLAEEQQTGIRDGNN